MQIGKEQKETSAYMNAHSHTYECAHEYTQIKILLFICMNFILWSSTTVINIRTRRAKGQPHFDPCVFTRLEFVVFRLPSSFYRLFCCFFCCWLYVLHSVNTISNWHIFLPVQKKHVIFLSIFAFCRCLPIALCWVCIV